MEVRKKVLALVRDKGTGDSLAVANAFKQKGLALKRTERYGEAAQSLLCAKSLLEIYLGPKHPQTRKVQRMIRACVKKDPSALTESESKNDDANKMIKSPKQSSLEV